MIVDIQRKSHIQHMTYSEFEDRIRDGEIPPDTRIRFEVVTGDQFQRAGDLEFYQVLADPERLAFRKKLTSPGMPILTALLVGFQIRVWMISLLPGGSAWLQERFTNWAPAIIEQGQVYRLITYGLLHTSFTHLLFNLYFLAYTGYHLERALGLANVAVLYFGSVYCGGLLSMWMAPERPSLGASGGDFGLLAAAVVLGWKHWESLPHSSQKFFGWALAPYLMFSLLSGLGSQNVDNWGHLGGLVGGLTMMTLLDPEVMPGRKIVNRYRRRVVIALLGALSLAIFLAGSRLVVLTDHSDENGWHVDRPQLWREGWTFTGDRGWFSPTQQANLSAATIVHSRPMDSDTASENLITRIRFSGKNTEIIEQQVLDIQGWDARQLLLQFELDEKPHQLTAVVLVRGVYEHRLLFQTTSEAAEAYAPLVDRFIGRIYLEDPDDLIEASRRANFHPHSWDSAVELGDALYRVGSPEEALDSYNKANRITPWDPQAVIGRLRVHADYSLMGGLDFSWAALENLPEDVRVIQAAADVIASEGSQVDAEGVLDAAWERMPNQENLRRVRLQWGLSVVADPDEVDDPLEDGAPGLMPMVEPIPDN